MHLHQPTMKPLIAMSLLLWLVPTHSWAQQPQGPSTRSPEWGILMIGPMKDDPRAPLITAGWVYHSVVKNGAVATVTFSRRQGHRETALWRGLQASTVIGSRGFEVGVGYGQYRINWTGWGYEIRALGGRPWTASSSLEPDQWYFGGEAALSWLFFRGSVGFVTQPGNSNRQVATASIGIVALFSSRPR